MGEMTDGVTRTSLAISTFLSGFVHSRHFTLKDRIVTSVLEANDTIFAKYKGSRGSTLSAIVIAPKEEVLEVIVGDSRIYSMED